LIPANSAGRCPASIYDYTKGVPRQINRLCTTALLVGMADNRQVLEESVIRKVVA
jgi:type II secretory pathway predicted ATPase ExeA